jgi:hypothetical protein
MLDHVTLRTNDLEGTRAFLEAVMDLRPGYRPAPCERRHLHGAGMRKPSHKRTSPRGQLLTCGSVRAAKSRPSSSRAVARS